MNKKEYQHKLYENINMYGYWSYQVAELNDKAIDCFGYEKYKKYSDEVTART